MITYLRTSLFESPAQTLVNTVNTVGVMGKGIAKEFKDRYPNMFKSYKTLCAKGEIDIGRLQLWRDENQWIINFPTKTTWKKPSKIEYIEQGLDVFVSSYKEMGISSVAFPPLGCGNGNLEWAEVKKIMERYLNNIDLSVYIHDRQVSLDFMPEHKEIGITQTPSSFEEFAGDVREKIASSQNGFQTISGKSRFSATWFEEDGILIDRPNGKSHIRPEHLEWAWSALQSGLLTFEQYPSDESRKTKSYLFAILAHLPYVRAAEVARPKWNSHIQAHGLYFDRASMTRGKNHAVAVSEKVGQQLCLYQDL